MSRESIGEFEKLVLLAVVRLDTDAYGAAIVREIEERTGRTAAGGAVYVALRRLERKGLLSSRKGETTPDRGGRPKRYYRIGREGLAALRQARDEWTAMTRGIEERLEEAGG
ncbi:MAG: PadR family transcriptional regulator [Gemmatimonadota bacterium]